MPNLNYRLCAIDLDDTLLSPEHTILPFSQEVIQKTLGSGVSVVIASGRMHEATTKFSEQLQLGDAPIISYNGAMVRCPLSGEIWLHETIPAPLAAQVLEICEARNLQLNFYLGECLYTAANTNWLDLYFSRTGAPIRVDPNFYKSMRGASPTKLLIVDSPEEVNELLPEFQALFGQSLYVTRSNVEYLEFMPPHANKGLALEAVADRMGISSAQTIAFGDTWNDIPMLKWAGLGVAVANAKPEVLEVAGKVAASNEEEGVAKALLDLLRI